MYNWQYIWLLLQVEEKTRNQPKLKHLHLAAVAQLESQSPVSELDPNEFKSGSSPTAIDETNGRRKL